jgi:4-amino-4-deoxy-L-arabinose transferase-like glycosyltransferase
VPTVAPAPALALERPVWWPLALDPFWCGVALISAGVLGFLLAQLNAWPPHEDETLAFFVGRQPIGDLFGTVLGERGGAPLHFLLTHLVATVSPGLTGLRLISVFFAVASVPVIACLVARLTDRATALLATLLVGTSWTLLMHGIYGRMYSLFLFTSTFSFLALLRALSEGGWRRWLLWIVVMLATLASMPYGAMVLGVQAAYVIGRRLRRPFSLRPALLSFAAVTLVAIPLWRTYLVLASRFDVGVGRDRPSALDSPYDVLVYIRDVVGDFTVGWTALFAAVVFLAAVGLVMLARRRPAAALLAALVFLVPTAALTLARLGSQAIPETRHLIFAFPFLAMIVASGLLYLTGLLGSARRAALGLGIAVLVSAQIAWGWSRTPPLYAGEAAQRTAARDEAAAWLARFLRPTDVLWGYNPLFLQAFEDGGRLGKIVVPRADPKLANRALADAPKPLGRGIWVLDASNSGTTPRYDIDYVPPVGFGSRTFGPFVVVWTKEPPRNASAYLFDTLAVQDVGRKLGVSDSDLNYETATSALRALARARGRG